MSVDLDLAKGIAKDINAHYMGKDRDSIGYALLAVHLSRLVEEVRKLRVDLNESNAKMQVVIAKLGEPV